MSDTLIHPVTGLRALGMGKRGPIWPVIGGNGEGDGNTADADTNADASSDNADKTNSDESAQTDEKVTDDEGNVDWKSAARRNEARYKAAQAEAKKNADAAKELEEFKRSKMSDEEKRAATEKAALDRAEAAERRAALAEAAIAHGLTKDDLELLDGVPADQIEARAKKLAERLKKAAPPDASGREAGGDRGKKKATSLDSAVAGYYA